MNKAELLRYALVPENHKQTADHTENSKTSHPHHMHNTLEGCSCF